VYTFLGFPFIHREYVVDYNKTPRRRASFKWFEFSADSSYVHITCITNARHERCIRSVYQKKSEWRNRVRHRAQMACNIKKNLWEELIAYFPFIRHGLHRKLRVQQFFMVSCIFFRGNMFTEPLPSRCRGNSTPLRWAQVSWYAYQVLKRFIQAFKSL
jgi:hypothetical protein